MTRKYLIDLAERVIFTYVETLVGLLLVGWTEWTTVGEFLDFGTSALIAAVPAALAVVKGGVARFRGDQETPSLASPPIRSSLGGRST